jgi:hypothetical protein
VPGLPVRDILALVSRIMQRHTDADPDNLRHTLLLLQKQPIERLRRALLRGRKIDIQR